jgi:hypothetical protein
MGPPQPKYLAVTLVAIVYSIRGSLLHESTRMIPSYLGRTFAILFPFHPSKKKLLLPTCSPIPA